MKSTYDLIVYLLLYINYSQCIVSMCCEMDTGTFFSPHPTTPKNQNNFNNESIRT